MNQTQITQGPLEIIRVKILLQGTDDNPSLFRLELSSESDLFFHYTHEVSLVEFQNIQAKQKLVVDFIDYATILIRMFNACIREPHTNLAIFTLTTGLDTNSSALSSPPHARLDFLQNMEYKLVELMYCDCYKSSMEIIQQQITFRYNSMKFKLSTTKNRLQEITNLVKIKNPSLLLQIQKMNTNSNGTNSALNTTNGGNSTSPVNNFNGGYSGMMSSPGHFSHGGQSNGGQSNGGQPNMYQSLNRSYR